MIINNIIIIIIIFIILLFINYHLNNNIIQNNDKYNTEKINNNILKIIYLIFNKNDLINYNNIQISKNIKPRKDVPIENKYELLKNMYDYCDYHYVIYYLSENKCKIIIRRLDSYEIKYDLKIKIYENNYKYKNNHKYNIINIKNEGKKNEIIIKYNTSVLLKKVIYEDTKIPKVIIQTGKTNNINLAQYNAALTFIELNPEYEYIYYDDNDIIEFLKKNFNIEVLNAYNKLIPGAYKADLFRYCYLYINGGCYFDNKMINRTPIRETLNKKDDIYLCNHLKDIVVINDNFYYNALIYSTQKNEIMKYCILKILDNVKNNYYGKNEVDVTGPLLLYKIASKYNKSYVFMHKFDYYYYLVLKLRQYAYIYNKNNKIICNTCYYDYYTKLKDPNNYKEMWLEKKIYNN